MIQRSVILELSVSVLKLLKEGSVKSSLRLFLFWWTNRRMSLWYWPY